MISSLYIHIPFCDNICSYCDFPKVYSSIFSHQEYLNKLIEELNSLNIKNKLKTIYIGGGTPSALKEDELEILLSKLTNLLDEDYEFTLEANPESLNEEKIKILSKYKINRVSLGVQSTDKKIKEILYRKHTNDQVIKVVNLLKDNNINNINLDFIYGLKESNINTLKEDLNFAIELKPTHLSFYSLILEKHTMLYNQKYKEKDDDEIRNEYDYINSYLINNDFNHYEVSNYALDNYYSKHNLVYWNDLNYYAIGVGASSYIKNQRITNTKSIINYLKGNYNKEIITLSKKDEEFEFLMLNLRKLSGFQLDDFNKRFNSSFLDKYKNKINKLKDYFDISSTSFKIKENYIYTMNNILVDLLDFE